MADLPKIISTFGLAFFSFWAAIPAGLALGLAPVVVVITTTLSYTTGVAVVTLFGDRLRQWLAKRRSKKMVEGDAGESTMQKRIRLIAERYGAIGLGLAAPMTTGAQIGGLLGVALNIPRRRLFLGMALGALVWSIVLTVITVAGVAGVQAVG